MVNLPSSVPGEITSPDLGRRRRYPSHPHTGQAASRQTSASERTLSRDFGVNKRVYKPPTGSTHLGDSPGLNRLTRARLPWLDGNTHSRSLPGSFVANQDPSSDVTLPGSIKVGLGSPSINQLAPPKTAIYQSDPQYRPYGSTQSIGQVVRKPDIDKPASDSATHPHVLKINPSSRSIGAMTRSIGREMARMPYTPSAYSVASPSESDLNGSLLRKDPASYERLVDRSSPTTLETLERRNKQFILQLPEVPNRRSSLAFDIRTKVDSVPPPRSSPPPPDPTRHSDGTLSVRPPIRTSSLPAPKRSASVPAVHVDQQPTSPQAGANSMQRAVHGLQHLMEEALEIAKDAAGQNKADEVTAVLNEATVALRRSSVVQDEMAEPFVLSESEVGIASSDDYVGDSDSDYDSDSEFSSIRTRPSASVDTVPTVYTMSSQSVQHPIVEPPFTRGGKAPKSEEAQFDLSKPDDSEPIPTSDTSILRTPPRLYEAPSADSIVIDFAYVTRDSQSGHLSPQQSIEAISVLPSPIPISRVSQAPSQPANRGRAVEPVFSKSAAEVTPGNAMPLEPIPIITTGPNTSDGARKRHRAGYHHDGRRLLESKYYHLPDKEGDAKAANSDGKRHISFRGSDGHLHGHRSHKYRRQPIAREWDKFRKRLTALIACLNTALVGFIAGVYAGEVPKIQYQLGDIHHRVILGNVMLYIGLGITTLVAWPLPLLHGRKPYTLAALAIALPLQFPQALCVQTPRSPDSTLYFVGLLLSRALSGMALGLANINFLATLFDLFGASLQARHPHQEIVDFDDPRRQGGGMGLWLGAWAWCFVGSLALGFLVGAAITATLNPDWGFYFVVILLAIFILMNVVAPETRRAPHRRSILHYFDEQERLKKKVARGEVKLHISQDGPQWWWEESWAGMKLMAYMMIQPGFFVLAWYLAWIYALVVLVTLLLGALLSRDYQWMPQYVGLAVFALAVGAALAIPLSKANLFSRERLQPPRTDSMTFQPRLSWSSHFVRRCIFTFTLPIAGLAFVLSSPGPSVSWVVPTIMSAVVGFLSCLAVAECIGLITETFDTCDLQPGVNSKHRLQSLESTTRRRRTNYSSYPRVAAGLFAAQGLGFFLAAGSTGVSGRLTRALGAQAAVGVVAGILLGLTLLLSLILWRWKTVQVIPDHALGTLKGSKDWSASKDEDAYWKPVVVGNPSGKHRRMNLLETGRWSRWTEIRKLNKLSKHASTLP